MVKKITLGIIKEGKIPPDKRVPLTPSQCLFIKQKYNNVRIIVQKSDIRIFSDDEYKKKGIELVDSLEGADIILGIKEVPVNYLINNKTYLFFSHTIKKQEYNRKLLQEILRKNIRLIDYECLKDKKGKRLIGFGRYAGIVGAYNAFLTWGKKYETYLLKAAKECENKAETEKELEKVKLPENFKVVVTGGGRVADGIQEILFKLKIKYVNPNDFLSKQFNYPVYTLLKDFDYYRRKDGKKYSRKKLQENPKLFESNFKQYTKVANMLITGHYWDTYMPKLFNLEDIRNNDFKISVIADISCDINGAVPTTIRSSTINSPIYGISKETLKECDFKKDDAIAIMAVDNLPCELPKDASEYFGKELIQKVIPYLIGEDKFNIIKNAIVTENAKLSERFLYLKDFVYV